MLVYQQKYHHKYRVLSWMKNKTSEHRNYIASTVQKINLEMLRLIQQTFAMPSIWSKSAMMCRNVTERYHSWCNCLLRVPKLLFASAKSCFKSPNFSVDSLNNRKICWEIQWKQDKRRHNQNLSYFTNELLLAKWFLVLHYSKKNLTLEIIEAAKSNTQ